MLPARCGGAALAFELAEAPSASLLSFAGLGLAGAAKEAHHCTPRPHQHPGFFPGPPRADGQRSGGRAPERGSQQPSPAAALQRSLGSVDAPAQLRDAVLPPPSATAYDLPSLAVRIGSLLQPQGETLCDR